MDKCIFIAIGVQTIAANLEYNLTVSNTTCKTHTLKPI